LSDGTRTVELYLIQGSAHHDGLIMAYFPKEKLLIAIHRGPPMPHRQRSSIRLV
jgi:hypothetical protein